MQPVHWVWRTLRGTTLTIAAEVFARAANTIFFILLARKLGESEAATYTLGFAFTSLLLNIALGGLDQLLTRETARAPERSSTVLGTFIFARALSALVCYLGLAVWLQTPYGYEPRVNMVVLVLAASLIPDCLTGLCRAYLIARDRVGAMTILSAITGATKLGIGASAILLGGDALETAWIVTGASLIVFVAHVWLVARWFGLPRISFDRQFWQSQMRAEIPLLLISIIFTIETSFDVLLLSFWNSLNGVGIFSAASVILNALVLLPLAFRQIILPILSQNYASSPERAFSIYEQINRILLLITLPICIGLTFSADHIMPIIYREQFHNAVPVMQILVWSFFFLTMLVPHGRLILVANQQRASVRFQTYSMIMNVGLNLILQPTLGPIGAALARLVSSTLACFLNLRYIRQHIYNWNASKIVRLPLAAGCAMALGMLLLREFNWNWISTLCLGMLIYALVLIWIGAVSRADIERLIAMARQSFVRRGAV